MKPQTCRAARDIGVLLSILALGPYSWEARAAENVEQESMSMETQQTVQANSGFTLALYQRLSQEQATDNLFFSPYSLFSALAMTIEGARGETARQMGEVLQFPDTLRRADSTAGQLPWNTAVIHTGAANLQQHLTSGPADPSQAQDIPNRLSQLEHELDTLNQQLRQGSTSQQTDIALRSMSVANEINTLRQQINQYELHIANALWGEQTFPFRPQFLEALQTAYGAVSFPVDFLSAPEAARMRINDWIAQQTKNRIQHMLARGTVDEATRLVLTNAIYFKGNWAQQFKKLYTKREDFTLFDGLQTPVQLMSARDMRFRYVELMPDGTERKPTYDTEKAQGWTLPPNPDGFQMLELPYRGDTLSMVVLLPRRHDAIHELEQRLAPEALQSWLGLLSHQQVHVYLPRFKMETSYSLKGTLSDMGMPAAFRPGGLTGMSDAPQAAELYLSYVGHKAFVHVNEEGTEAAAASAVVAAAVGAYIEPPTPVFRADRPFLFLIRDNQTGAVLFLGRVMRPED